ncbi:MAG: hypothetical protein P4L53_04950 [Candidatus Obscuribacterales bacterium]|nr:hypothetical protein [Candidatus Obscuribacterales bacterium]
MAVPAQKTHLKPLSALVFNFILGQALQRHFLHPLFLSLDEFTNFDYIPAIAEKLTKISDSLGQKTEVERKVTSSGQIVERQFGRPLLDPNAVMAIRDGVAIALTPATPPIMVQCFTWKDHESATKNPPPERRELHVDESLKKTSKHRDATAKSAPVKTEEPDPSR